MGSKNWYLLLLTGIFSIGAQADDDFEFSARLLVDGVDYQETRTVDGIESRYSNDDFYVRQAKLKLEARLTDRLKFEASAKYDLSEDGRIANLFLAFEPAKDWSLVVGQFKEPAGMEKMQSLGSQFFNERSLATNVFSAPRKPGIKIEYDGKWAWAQAAYMRADSRSPYFDDGDVLAAKIAIRPYRDNSMDAFLHLGGFYSTREEVELSYDSNEPLTAPSFGNSFRSPNYYADRIDTGGVEFAAGFRKLVLQAEVFAQEIFDRDGDEWRQNGYYATVSWTAWGKPRKHRNAELKYSKKNDSALELSARISEADSVNFGEGDRARVLSFAASYLLRRHYEISLEYESAELEGSEAGLAEELSGNSLAVRLNARF